MATPEQHKDDTFRKYAPDAAKRYAAFRPPYPPKFIDTVLSLHTSTGGGTTTLLDVGCGPGTATQSLAPLFTHAYAADPGTSMIEAARSTPILTASGEEVKWAISTAEDLLESIPEIKPGSVDLITAATAAHWFKMPGFYAAAAKLLKPGGSIAMWCSGLHYCHPHTTPNAVRVREMMLKWEEEYVIPFELPGNSLCRGLYEGLELPWTLTEDVDAETKAAVEVFDEGKFEKVYFNKGGELEEGETFVKGMKAPLEMITKGFATASPVARWREAHKEELEKGEVEDCLDVFLRITKETLAEVPDGVGRDWIEGGSEMVLLVIKKKDS
jgi:SAM-dependent methyltransferase